MLRTRIILADDHVLILEALKNMLEPEFEIVGTFSNGLALVEGLFLLRFFLGLGGLARDFGRHVGYRRLLGGQADREDKQAENKDAQGGGAHVRSPWC